VRRLVDDGGSPIDDVNVAAFSATCSLDVGGATDGGASDGGSTD
jgi:hypothetical protein